MASLTSLVGCPCFRCFFWKSIEANVCNPETCNVLSEWLALLAEEKICPACGSTRIVKAGFSGDIQRYKCKNCKVKFNSRPGFEYRMKHPTEIVDYARKLASQKNRAFSSRDIAKQIFLKFRVNVSHVTVATWLRRS